MKKQLLFLATAVLSFSSVSATDYKIFPIDGQVWTENSGNAGFDAQMSVDGKSFSINTKKASSTTALITPSANEIRVYKNSDIVISSSDVNFKTVKITTKSGYSKECTLSAGWTGSLTDLVYTLTNASGSNTITLSATNAQVRISEIIISDDGQGGGVDPTPAPTGDLTLLASDKANGFDNWTVSDITKPESVSAIWAWKSYSGAYYLNASAYADGAANASEAWAISPVVKLASDCESLSFEQAAKFQTTLRTECGIGIREKGATTWTMLTIPAWPEAGSWTFVNSGDIDVKAYAGKEVEIGFKYGSTADGSDTWEIRNLSLKGEIVGGGETPVDPVVSDKGSAEKPLTVSEFLSQGVPSEAVADTYLKGYIVGYVPGQKFADAVFSATAEDGSQVSATNIVLAENANETNYEKCVPIQLPAGTIRTELNLADNAGNLGKMVTLLGSREKYFGVSGLKTTSKYAWGETMNETPAPSEETAHSVKEFYSLGTGKNIKADFPLTVTFVTGVNCYAVDEEGTPTLIYGTTPYVENDIIPAGWTGTYSPYNGLPEIKPSGDMPAAAGQGHFTPISVTPADINDNLLNAVVVIKSVKFDEATPVRDAENNKATNFNGYDEAETVTILFRTNFEIASVAPGIYDVKAAIATYNGTIQVYPISYSATSGVEAIGMDNSSAKYYDLNGRVINPSNMDKGIYIRVVDGKATKIVK